MLISGYISINKYVSFKNKTFVILLLFLLVPAAVSADIIPNDSHWVRRCAKIVNLADFPKFAFAVAYLPAPRYVDDKNTVIHDDSCIQQRPAKFGQTTLYLFAIYQSYLAEHPVETINFAEDNNVFKSNLKISSGGFSCSNNNLLKKEILEYTIRGFNGQTLLISLSKQKDERYSLQELEEIRDQQKHPKKRKITDSNGKNWHNVFMKTLREKKVRY